MSFPLFDTLFGRERSRSPTRRWTTWGLGEVYSCDLGKETIGIKFETEKDSIQIRVHKHVAKELSGYLDTALRVAGYDTNWLVIKSLSFRAAQAVSRYLQFDSGQSDKLKHDDVLNVARFLDLRQYLAGRTAIVCKELEQGKSDEDVVKSGPMAAVE